MGWRTIKAETWSNVAYILLGAIWLYEGHIGLGGLAVLLGVMSAYSHHTRDWFPDWGAMYAMFFGLIFNGLDWPPVLGWLGFFLPYNFKSFYGSFITIGIVWFLAFVLGSNHLLVAIVFAIAFAVRQIGDKPSKYYQLTHSIWHVLTALGIYLIR